MKHNTNTFVEKANLVHKNKYDYSQSVYGKNNKEKIKIICLKHGEFYQMPYSHLDGHGCPLCKGENSTKINTKPLSVFIDDATKIHGNRYDYSKVKYIRGHSKVEIICKKHGNFYQTPNLHIVLKHGCPKCKLSHGELRIIKFLESNNIEYVTQKTFNDFRNSFTDKMYQYDFYIPSKNVLIEYDGKQHFEYGGFFNGKHQITEENLKEIQYRDKVKTEYANQKNIRLLRIKYTEIKNIEKFLEKEIL